MATLKENTYENRLVLFLDILGFKELVIETEKDPALIGRITSVIDHIKNIGDKHNFYKTQQVTQFSDCMVISYHVNEPAAVFELVLSVGFMLVDLVGFGFLLRGAITSGQLLHSKKHVLGPAMVQAYYLEHYVAKYPRIVVDDSILKYAEHFPARQNSSEDELGYVKGFLQRDTDDQLYVDYVTWRGVVEVMGLENDKYPQHLSYLSEIIERGLKNSDPNILEKYVWLHDRYMTAIGHFRDTPINHRGRREYPELYESILSLPQFEIEIRTAKHIIAKHARPGKSC